MINIKTGEILIYEVHLYKGMHISEFEHIVSQADIVSKQKAIYSNYFIKSQRVNNIYINLDVYFNQEDIISFVQMSTSDIEGASSWENWSEEKEMRRKITNDLLLESEIGLPPYEYYWGGISSLYDPRTASSHITLRYLY